MIHPPLPVVRDVVRRALAEDIGALGDLTSALIPVDIAVTGSLTPRVAGVLAGCLSAQETFAQVDPGVQISWGADDGQEVEAGRPVARVEGSLSSILSAERTALNFLCHLSGVATMTRSFVRATHGRARVWDTRKTLPGLRALEKAAVRAGGGVNHRGSLSEFVLLKDNHLAGIGIAEAARRARLRWPGRSVEIECETRQQVEQCLEAGADLVLLDNMSPQEVTDCVELVAAHATATGGRRCLVEVSGGVTLDNVGAYAGAGADLISAGAITMSAPALDIGLDLDPVERA